MSVEYSVICSFFLRNKFFKRYLRLCGTTNTITICKLFFINDPETNINTTIIGNGWKRFCSCNRITHGTKLEFKCDSIMAKNIIIIFRLTGQQ